MNGRSGGTIRLGSVLAVLAVTACAQAAAVTMVYDHFDDGTLDPAWQISMTNASDWSYLEAGTNLTVDDVQEVGTTSFATVCLSRTFYALTDFHVDFDFSWASDDDVQATQVLTIALYDKDGIEIASASYSDPWTTASGEKNAFVGTDSSRTGPGSMPLAGSASVDIDRVGEDITVLWDGSSMASNQYSEPLKQIKIYVKYLPYAAGGSFFGTESVDLVHVEGTMVPEPVTMVMLALGGVALLMRRRRRR